MQKRCGIIKNERVDDMKNTISEKSLKLILKMQQNELTESYIYENIAKFAKGEENKEIIRKIGREERAHYEIWKN